MSRTHAVATDDILVASRVGDDDAMITPMSVIVGTNKDFSDTPKEIRGYNECAVMYIDPHGNPQMYEADFTYLRCEDRTEKPSYADACAWFGGAVAIGIVQITKSGEQILFRVNTPNMRPNPLARLLIQTEYEQAEISGPIIHLKGEARW